MTTESRLASTDLRGFATWLWPAASVLALLLSIILAVAPQSAAAITGSDRGANKVAAADAQMLCINEGATTVSEVGALQERYRPLANLIGNTTGKKVNIVAFTSVALFQADFKAGKCHYAFGKTIDALSEGIEAGGYRALTKTSKPYVAGIILAPSPTCGAMHVTKPLASITDLVGCDVMLPPKDTFTAQLALAEFRKAGIKAEERHTQDRFPTELTNVVTIRYIRFQEAVGKTVETNWYPAGVVNPTILGDWVKKKGKVLMKLKPQPGWAVLANSALPEKQQAAVSKALLAANDDDEGRAMLKAMKIDRMEPATNDEYISVLKYLRSN